jgi:hypothetical protein
LYSSLFGSSGDFPIKAVTVTIVLLAEAMLLCWARRKKEYFDFLT